MDVVVLAGVKEGRRLVSRGKVRNKEQRHKVGENSDGEWRMFSLLRVIYGGRKAKKKKNKESERTREREKVKKAKKGDIRSGG